MLALRRGSLTCLDNEWEMQHEQRSKQLESELNKLKVSEQPAVVRTVRKSTSQIETHIR